MRRRPAAVRAFGAALAAVLTASIASSPALASGPPRLLVRAAILVEQSTGRVLDAVNPDRELPIASTTKLMTTLVTLEHVRRLGTLFVDPDWHPAPNYSQIGLVPGERMSVHDLLLAMLLPSADDAAQDVAYNVGHGSVTRFVAMMNRRARELDLAHTHYTTPIGIDTPGNYSTAADLVRLASYLLEHSRFFASAVALPSATLYTGDHVRDVVNRNDLVGRYPWITGVKTGQSPAAGDVLIASARRNGMTLLSVVLGTSSESARDANTLALLDYGFSNFKLVKPVRAGQVLARPFVQGEPRHRAAVISTTAVTRVVGSARRVVVRVHVARMLAGPLAARTVVGYAVVLAGKRQIARVPLVLARRLPGQPVPGTAASPSAGAGDPAALPVAPPTALVSLLVVSGAIVLAAARRSRSHGRGQSA